MQFPQYMEDKREEARAKLKEDDERKRQADKMTKSWALMRETVAFLKANADGWRERRI